MNGQSFLSMMSSTNSFLVATSLGLTVHLLLSVIRGPSTVEGNQIMGGGKAVSNMGNLQTPVQLPCEQWGMDGEGFRPNQPDRQPHTELASLCEEYCF